MFSVEIEKELRAPTLLSVRKKASSSDVTSGEESITGEDEEEDPIVSNLEPDEVEPQRETIEDHFVRR